MKPTKKNEAKRPESAASAASRERAKARKAAASSQEQTFGAAVLDWIKSMLMGLLLFLFIRTFALQTYTIISGSMEDTFLIGDFIVVNKVAYGATVPWTHARIPGYDKPHRGDIVVFNSNHNIPVVSLVKRLVGQPGDTISMTNGVLFVNGKSQPEPFTKHTAPQEANLTQDTMLWQRQYLLHKDSAMSYVPRRDTWGPLVVPPERYFMMGDNRDESFDSRYWGFVKKDEIIGRASLIYFSWDAQPADPPLVHHVRWGRIGTRLP